MCMVKIFYVDNPVPDEEKHYSLNAAQLRAEQIVSEGVVHKPKGNKWAYYPAHRIRLVLVEEDKSK